MYVRRCGHILEISVGGDFVLSYIIRDYIDYN